MNEDRNTDTATNMEPAISSGTNGENADKEDNSRVCIIIHSFRKRLADPDGISAKAAIDGIVQAGILKDDSAKEVEEVRFKQYKSNEEKTVIEVIGI